MSTKIKYFKLDSDELKMKIKELTNKDFFSLESRDIIKEQLESSIKNLESLSNLLSIFIIKEVVICPV